VVQLIFVRSLNNMALCY